VDEVDALLADLARWTGESAMATAARSRSRERWLRQQAAEDARFLSVLVDLVEHGETVVVTTTVGTVARGRVVAVAADFAVVAPGAPGQVGHATLVRLDAIASARPEPGRRTGEAVGDRSPATTATLADVLGGVAAERPRVTLVVGGAGAVTGELRAVGADVITLRLEGSPPPTLYVRLATVVQVTLL